MRSVDRQSHPRETSLRAALLAFRDEALRAPRDVPLVFLSVAVLGILSYHVGSKRFFYEQWYDVLKSDRLYELYQYLYWFSAEFVIYFLLPVLLIVVVHKRPLRSFGLGFGDWRFGLKLSVIFLAVMLPILWVASASPAFQQVYPHASIVRGDWTLFAMYEAGFLLYFIGWEFIWRGYVVFGLAPHTGATVAVLVQTLPFVMLHYGKPLPETLGAIVAGIALGALSLRVRSFWYAVLIHWSVMFCIDMLSTLRFRTEEYGLGLDTLFRIFSAFAG